MIEIPKVVIPNRTKSGEEPTVAHSDTPRVERTLLSVAFDFDFDI
jgi:hypothetical protein